MVKKSLKGNAMIKNIWSKKSKEISRLEIHGRKNSKKMSWLKSCDKRTERRYQG